MNTKIIIALMAIATLISCNTKNKTAGEGEEHEEHSPNAWITPMRLADGFGYQVTLPDIQDSPLLVVPPFHKNLESNN